MRHYQKSILRDDIKKLEKEVNALSNSSFKSLKELNDYTIKVSHLKELKKKLYGRHDQVGSGPEVYKFERLIQEAYVKSKTRWDQVYKPLCKHFTLEELQTIAKEEGIPSPEELSRKELCRKIAKRVEKVLESF